MRPFIPLFLLFLFTDLISRLSIFKQLSYGILYPEMVLAGVGADIAVSSLIMLVFIILSFVFKSRWFLPALLVLVQFIKGFLNFTNHQYSVLNFKLFPLANFSNYGGQAIVDPLYFKGVVTELYSFACLIFFTIKDMTPHGFIPWAREAIVSGYSIVFIK